jgi:hypothetical protein
MPANLYSNLQYAKKANLYYENEAQFWADAEITNRSTLRYDGVLYINGPLTISQELTVTGRVLLVAREEIRVSANIRRGDNKTVFGLMSRTGSINVANGCTLIQAACYSQDTFTNPDGNALVIDGNLVVNKFSRAVVGSLDVVFNGAATRISPFSLLRDVGKFDPKRYIVSIGKQWTRFEFAKQ